MRNWILALALFLGCSCSGASQEIAKQGAVTAADIVNEVSLRGDQVYSVSVQTCNLAERTAVTTSETAADAKALVYEIRRRCDVAFALLEKLRVAIETVDRIMGMADEGKVDAAKVANAALDARDLFQKADVTHRELSEFLGKVGK